MTAHGSVGIDCIVPWQFHPIPLPYDVQLKPFHPAQATGVSEKNGFRLETSKVSRSSTRTEGWDSLLAVADIPLLSRLDPWMNRAAKQRFASLETGLVGRC